MAMKNMLGPKMESSKAKGGEGKAEASSRDAEHEAPPRLLLSHGHLKKLGMTKMPPVGSKIHISGVAHVGATSEDQDGGMPGGKRRSI